MGASNPRSAARQSPIAAPAPAWISAATAFRQADGPLDALFAGGIPYRFHHLGVRVPSDRAAERTKRELGLIADWVNDLDEHECRCHFCPGPGIAVELVVPLAPSSTTNAIPHALHHVGIEVRDLEETQTILEEGGYTFTDRRPLMIVDRYLVNFVRPLRLSFLIELVEDRGHRDRG